MYDFKILTGWLTMGIGTFYLWFCKLEADELSFSYFLETMLNFDVYCTGSYNWFTFKFDFAIMLGFIYGFSTINDFFIHLITTSLIPLDEGCSP